MTYRVLVFTGIVVSMLMYIGCGKKNSLGAPTYKVTGKVQFEGQPIGGATIMFLPLPDQKIQSASAISDQSGNYILGTQNKGDGAMQGKYIVTVSKTETIGKLMTQEEQDAMPYSPVAGPDLKFKDALPVKYKTKDSSDLRYEVTSSQNNKFDIDLKK